MFAPVTVRSSRGVLATLFSLVWLGLVPPARALGERTVVHPSTPAAGVGAVIDVPGDQPTIQAGVDAAVDGDVVVVAAGTYTGPGNRDVDFHGKRIVVRAATGAQVVIDCQGGNRDRHRGFIFQSGEGADSVVEGFVIRNGNAPGVPVLFLELGGGAVCLASSPTFRGCTFKANVARFGGGGVGCNQANPSFVDCVFQSNDVPPNGMALGGGGLLLLDSSPRFEGCTFEDNTSMVGGAFFLNGSSPSLVQCSFRRNRTSGGGGALYSQSPSSPVLERCSFVENEAGQGGAISFLGTLLSLESCSFEANSAGRGGAIFCESPARIERSRFFKNKNGAVYLDFAFGVVVFEGNEFVANVSGTIESGGEGGKGGAIYSRGSNFLVEENRFASNRALGASSARGGAIYSESSLLTLRDNDFEDNAVEIDPQFPNSFDPNWEAAGGAIYLEESGPVLGGPGAGGNTFLGNRALAGADVFKQGGFPVVDARSNAFTIFPVSSYYLAPLAEFDVSVGSGLRPALAADVTVSPTGVDAEGAPGDLRTLDFALSRLAPSAGNVLTIHLAPGTYSPSTTGESFPVKMIEHARIVGAGPGLSIVDAQTTQGVIICFGIDDAEISGLRITGGMAAEGGGILCRSASPLIQGNRIDANSGIWGGGIACMNGASPLIRRNEIVDNSTLDSPYFAKLGGGVVCFSSSPVLRRNVIARNFSHDYGGGVMCNAAGANAALVNDTLTANQASVGAALTAWNNAHPTLRNCILWGNDSEISVCCGATAAAEYTDVAGTWPGTGNLDVDPLFVDALLGDYNLTETSSCIDAGDPASPVDADGTTADVGALPFFQGAFRAPVRPGERR